jgi:hypothetical protein
MVPQHAQESLQVGLAFAAAGWFQIAFGAAILARPARVWVQLAIATNLVFIATWMLSRTVGLPTWTGDGGVNDASSIDMLCVAFEAGIVLGGVALLAAPNLLERWKVPALAAAGIVPVAILVTTTAVLVSPDAANHAAAGEHADPGEHADTGDHAGADAGDHAAAGEHSDAAAGGHADPGEHTDAAADDHAGASDQTDAGDHHADSEVTYADLPEATRAEVDQVIAQWATRYPTAGDATKDGWFMGTRSLYGIGAHYIRGNVLNGAATFDLLNPNILLFDGDGPDAKFAGVSYTVADRPEGFTGDYDTWHSHESVCRQGGSIISLSEEDSPVWLSESECQARGGQVFPLSNAEMMHLWIGPDYIDGAPIFAHDHPELFDGFNPKSSSG